MVINTVCDSDSDVLISYHIINTKVEKIYLSGSVNPAISQLYAVLWLGLSELQLGSYGRGGFVRSCSKDRSASASGISQVRATRGESSREHKVHLRESEAR